MNYSFFFKLFLTGLCFTALGIYSIQSGFLDITDDIRRLLPPGTGLLQFSKQRVYNHNIGPFPSKNRSSCSCKGYSLNAQNVPVDELEDLQRRRSEEYRQYQLRMGTKMESLILAQPNSPLQYPIQGFVVEPLAKSVIPGLALHAQKRRLYKVCFNICVAHGGPFGFFWFDIVSQGARSIVFRFARAYRIQMSLFCVLQV